MSSLNYVILMGNLTRDPEKKTLPGGMSVTEFGLAMADNFKDKDGKLVERTCFAEIVAWGKQAEVCEQFLKKGSRALIEGKLQLDQWTNEKGEKRSRLRIKANRVQFMNRPAGAGSPKTNELETSEERIEPVPF